MRTRVIVRTFTLADLPPPSAVGRDPLNDLLEMACHAEGHAEELLAEEADDAAAAWSGDRPSLSVIDALGRPLIAARLERQPDTDEFTLVLLSADDLSQEQP